MTELRTAAVTARFGPRQRARDPRRVECGCCPAFRDIEGSTRLLQELGSDVYAEALAQHRRLMRAAFAAHGRYEVDCEGVNSGLSI